eukprot:scaffold281_cov318-Pavlova_lutheri.AAC.64
MEMRAVLGHGQSTIVEPSLGSQESYTLLHNFAAMGGGPWAYVPTLGSHSAQSSFVHASRHRGVTVS